MSAEPARHLKPVETATGPPPGLRVLDPEGQLVEEYETYLQGLHDHIAGLQRDVAAEHLRYENLKRDKAAEAQAHPLWPKAVEVFRYWKKVCAHPNSKFSPDRFELILPYLEKYGLDACKRAVDGAAFEPFVTNRKNGTKKRHDGIGLVFRDADRFEDFCNRAPLRREEQPCPKLPSARPASPEQTTLTLN